MMKILSGRRAINANKRHPVSLRLFIKRAISFFCILSFVQLLYLTFIAEFSISNVVILFFIFIIGFGMLIYFYHLAKFMVLPKFNIKIFTTFFIISFLFTLFFSRMDYILVSLNSSMYETRISEHVGGGGIYSYITVFFYPLCGILVFVEIKKTIYRLFFTMMALIFFIDLLILGTRGAIIFVLFIHILMFNSKILTMKNIILLLALGVVFIFIFDYQTQQRSLDTYTDAGWDWLRTIRYSWIFDNLAVNANVAIWINDNAYGLFPLVYLIQYITHSIAEFGFLIDSNIFNYFGNLYYIQDQSCVVIGCDRASIADNINNMNPRYGVYQTMYSTLFFDFGVIGTSWLFLFFLSYLFVFSRKFYTIPIIILSVMFFLFSSIENFSYNAFTFIRTTLFILLWIFLSTKIKLKLK